jgi:broad specificity phosphatase PhoE
MTTFLLIRHGENDWVGRRLPGWTPGLHLNQRGRAQAQALVELLRPVRLEAIYSSPLERALESARPLARSKGLAVRHRRPGRCTPENGAIVAPFEPGNRPVSDDPVAGALPRR